MLDDLDVRVFNNDTIGIQVGEVAKIIGDIIKVPSNTTV